jgi:CarD family transcriptional regulator
MAEELTVGQRIVHSRYGAGVVIDLRSGDDDEEHDSYYVIEIPSSALTVHLPVDAVEQVNLREISSKRRMNQALRILSQEPEQLPKDYRERRAMMQQSVSEGAIRSVANVVRDLTGLKRVKKNMSTMELALLTNAKRRLAGELALVSDIELPDAMQAIENALRKDENDED